MRADGQTDKQIYTQTNRNTSPLRGQSRPKQVKTLKRDINDQPQREYKQSLTFRVRRYSNETRAPIANPPNSAQIEGTIYTIPLSYIRVHALVWECGKDRHTDTQTAVANIHFASAMPHAKCKKGKGFPILVTERWARS